MIFTDFDFLCFDDIIRKLDHDEDWITVVERDADFVGKTEKRKEIKNIHSVLIPNSIAYTNKILSRYYWEVDWDFVKPYSTIQDEERKIQKENIFFKYQLEIEPFIFEETMFNKKDHTFYYQYIVHPDFRNHINLSFDSASKQYLDRKNPVIIMDNPKKMRIRRMYLQNYLKAKNKILVRYHLHYRKVMNHPKLVFSRDSENKLITENDRIFNITLKPIPDMPNETYSTLSGKDLIMGA